VRAIEQREAHLVASVAQLGEREAELRRRETAATVPAIPEPAPPVQTTHAQRVPTAASPVPPPAPTPTPSVRPSAAAVDAVGLTLHLLERLTAEHPHRDAAVQEEREAMLFALRDVAAVDGTLPPQYAGLVDEVFGELLAQR
jgi:hypothetical protein